MHMPYAQCPVPLAPCQLSNVPLFTAQPFDGIQFTRKRSEPSVSSKCQSCKTLPSSWRLPEPDPLQAVRLLPGVEMKPAKPQHNKIFPYPGSAEGAKQIQLNANSECMDQCDTCTKVPSIQDPDTNNGPTTPTTQG